MKTFMRQKNEVQEKEARLREEIVKSHLEQTQKLVDRIQTIQDDYHKEQKVQQSIMKQKDDRIAKLKAEIWKCLHILKIPRLKEYAY
jgi:hypothetical protein